MIKNILLIVASATIVSCSNISPKSIPPEDGEVRKDMPQEPLPKGLYWLSTQQNNDGSWGEDLENRPALTSLALLAYLALGKTPGSSEYGESCIKALKWLVEYSQGLKERPVTPYVVYALSESYAMTKIPMVKVEMDHRIKQLLKLQNSDGSFDYNCNFSLNFDLKQQNNLIFNFYNTLAVKAAYCSGCDVPELEAGVDKLIKYLKSQQLGQGQGIKLYPHDTTSDLTSTVLGAHGLTLLGESKSKEVKSSVEHIESTILITEFNHTDNIAPTISTQCLLFLLWDQNTKRAGSKAYSTFNKLHWDYLVQNQHKQGYWELNKSVGSSIEGTSLSESDARIYSTSIAVGGRIGRWLPTFKLHKHDEDSHKVIDNSDDLGITF